MTDGKRGFLAGHGRFPAADGQGSTDIESVYWCVRRLAANVSACWPGADVELVSRSAVDGVETTIPVDTSKDPRNGALGM
jgi:hypothetical protein